MTQLLNSLATLETDAPQEPDAPSVSIDVSSDPLVVCELATNEHNLCEVLDDNSPDSSQYELTTQLMAKLCHDFISPTGAIVSGLDLLDDPTAADMRDDAINLIKMSSKKLVTLISFARIAYGAATSAESFSAKQIKAVLEDSFSTMRATLDFQIEDELIISKPNARALVNLGYIAGNALPSGGVALIRATTLDSQISFQATSSGKRARLKTEAIEGIQGQAVSDGLSGQWIQPFWLHSVVKEAGGALDLTMDTDQVVITITLPV